MSLKTIEENKLVEAAAKKPASTTKKQTTTKNKKAKEAPKEGGEEKQKEEEEKPYDQMNDEEKEGKVKSFLIKMISSGSDAAIASLLDNFSLGNFREAICDIYKRKTLNDSSSKEIKEISDKLHETPEFKQFNKQYKEVASRKDDNTSTEIDPDTVKYSALFYDSDPEKNMLKQLEQVVTEIQKSAVESQKHLEEVKNFVSSKKLNEKITEDDITAFGPFIYKDIKANKSPDAIVKHVEELRSGVKESFERKLRNFNKHVVLSEGMVLLTEKQRKIFLFESMCESDRYITALTEHLYNEGYFDTYLLTEGVWDKVKSVAKGTAKAATAVAKGVGKVAAATGKFAFKALPQKWQDKLKGIVKDMSEKALNFMKDGGLAPILKIAGIGLMIASGAWGIGLIVASVMLIEKHGKQIQAALELGWTKFANSKGVITKMSFGIKDKKDLKYEARFYVTGLTWRVVNVTNQLKHPSKDFAKAILTGEIGKKYIDRVKELWDKVFSKEKGGQVDFTSILSQAKNIKISDKQLKLITDFRNQYDSIISNMQKPQIDTRTQSKKEMSKK